MNNETNLSLQAKLVSPLGARQYVLSRGWQPVEEGVSSRIYLFRHPEDRLRQIAIPMDKDYEDYSLAITDAANRLSETERRPLAAVLTDLLMPGADALRVRLHSQRAESGSVPFLSALALLEGAKGALLASAQSVDHPQAYHPRLNRTEGKELIEGCRFGQTERGSFVLAIYCPLDAVGVPPAPDVFEPEAGPLPFVRRTTNLLMRSVARLVSAIETNRLDSAFENTPREPALSANLCDALLTMLSADGDWALTILLEEEASITLHTSWAAILPQAKESRVPSAISIRPDFFPAISQARQRLHPASEQKESFYVGTVEELRGELDVNGKRAGEVVLSLLHEDEKIPARVNLNAEQYAIADQVHMAPGGFVKLHGILERGKRLSRIVELKDFERILAK
jgi:hypothetical protein